jgi:hypothetical protein
MLSSPEEVAKFLDDRFSGPDVILFAGAGVGKRIQLPDWPEYVELLAKFAEGYEKPTADLMRLRAAENQYAEAFEFLNRCRPIVAAERYRALAAPFLQCAYDPAPLKSLVSLPFKSIATTNFDSSLLEAYVQSKGKLPKTAGPSDTPLKECPYWDEFFVARIHGKVEHPPSMVLSTEAYARLENDAGYIDFLNHILTHKRCLFIGFSFIDPAIGNVLRSIADKSIISKETHHALLPESASPELLGALAQIGVRAQIYRESPQHSILWDGIEIAASAKPKAKILEKTTPPGAANRTKQLVALSYAITTLNSEAPGLSTLILGGIVLSSIQPDGSTLPEIAAGVRAVIPMDLTEAESRVLDSLEGLTTSQLVHVTNLDERVWTLNQERLQQSDPIEPLLVAVRNRLAVRETVRLDPKWNQAVAELIRQIVTDRAWELAQDFMSAAPAGRADDKPLVDKIVALAGSQLPTMSGDMRNSVSRVIGNLLVEPEPQEESIIADLVRVAFGVQIMTNTGRSALHGLVLPQNLYLDSNILLPLIIEGHPSYRELNASIRKLRRTSGTVNVYVADVFLNEVVSHRRLAQSEYKDLGLDQLTERDQYLDYYGLMGINAFIAGYINRPSNCTELSFEEWLDRIAPYTSERQLSTWLKSRDLLTVATTPGTSQEMRSLGEYEAALDKAYELYETRREFLKRKPDVLKDHEARQIRILDEDIRSGKRSFFVTDDKKLKEVVQLTGMPGVEDAVISNLALIQLIDLTVGIKCEPHVINRIVWSVRMLDDKMFLREYLVSRIQKKYDAAMLLTLPKMLDTVVEQAAKEAHQEKVQIRPTRNMDKAKTSRFINRIEKDFYAEMAREMAKTKEQQSDGASAESPSKSKVRKGTRSSVP